jgi:tetratricopeptide (TPR) repeat protein
MAESARRLGDRTLEFRASRALFLSSSEVCDMAQADAALVTCTRLAEELGQPVLRWQASYLRINRAWSTGRFSEIESLCDETRRLGAATGQPDHLGHSLGPLAMLRAVQGRFDEAAEAWRAVYRQLPRAPAFSMLMASALAESGEVDEARSIVAPLARAGFSTIHDDYMRLVALCFLGRASVRLGETSYVEELYGLLARHPSAIVMAQTVWLGPVSHELGLLATALGRHDDADGHFAAAAAVQERIEARGTLVFTRLEWARMLLRRGRAEDLRRARALLEAAKLGAAEAGLPIVERQVDALLTLASN